MANRLAGEKSPYLLQHAGNPVDWHPWGDEAFDRAKREDKPVFLSIGYATCHWCHVMAHESFEDPEVARLMNSAFVPVKVDREERPEIDHVFMEVCQRMTGGGGWPLTIIMTPDKRPFFAATYIPRGRRFDRPGMLELLPAIAEAWRREREELIRSADRIVEAVRRPAGPAAPGEANREALPDRAFERLSRRFDHRNGGFGQGVKFPMPHQLLFLLRYAERTGSVAALAMVEKTLGAMRQGGIYDHVGSGFHRYSTDAAWRVPHFEKMLYDQALLLWSYAEAHQATGKAEYGRTARDIGAYLLRELTSEGGAFFCAEDADSQGEEGRFYLWTEQEVRAEVPPEMFDLLADAFGLSPEGNFEDEATGRRTGLNILSRRGTLAQLAARRAISEGEAEARLQAALERLALARAARARPLRDDKLLADWNGLAIGALARAGAILDEPRFVEAARRAAAFVEAHLTDPAGRLLHRYRDGEAGIPAYLDDYAFFAFGLIELYQATFDRSYLERAAGLSREIGARFGDPDGGFYLTASDAEALLFRAKPLYDGAVPSGNAMAVYNLARLARLTGDPWFDQQAASASEALAPHAAAAPEGHALFLLSIEFALGSPK